MSKYVASVLLVLLTLTAFAMPTRAQTGDLAKVAPVQVTRRSRCTGSAYCSACTNCSRCAYCGAGGTCGVCAGTSSGRGSGGSSAGSGSFAGTTTYAPAPAPRATPRPRPTPTPKLPATFTARVVGITDGDTLTVLTASNRRIKIRLSGVDAPEKAQAFGAASKQALSALAYDKTVTVRVRDTDRYGRTVADVGTGGTTVNREQVKRGMAWWYKQYAPKDATLQGLEQDARTAKRGLWKDANPVAPWDFRRKKG